MNIMDIVLPGINLWFLLVLLLAAFILGMFAALHMFSVRGYYRDGLR